MACFGCCEEENIRQAADTERPFTAHPSAGIIIIFRIAKNKSQSYQRENFGAKLLIKYDYDECFELFQQTT